MPRFFFDVTIGDGRIDDVEGLSLPDLEAARLAGLRIVRETLAHKLLRDPPLRETFLEIRDEGGNLIERVECSPDCGTGAGEED